MKNWYLKLPNPIRAGVNTAWQSALGSFLLVLVGFLDDVKEWAGCTGTCTFPAVSPLGKAVASIVVGLAAGIITVGYRSVKPGPVYPGTGTVLPAQPLGGEQPLNRGQITVHVLLAVVAVVCGVLLLLVGLGAITMNGDAPLTIAGIGIATAGLACLL